MEPNSKELNVTKQRHGCVTAWLILMIVLNSLTAIVYFFASDLITQNLPGEVSTSMIILLGVVGVANVVFSILLFQWEKLGFWGFIGTSLAALIINLSIGLSVIQSIFGLTGLAILYGVLQIKKDDKTAWENLN
jgi:hypothetical protein